MFERFRRSGRTEAGATAVREREGTAAAREQEHAHAARNHEGARAAHEQEAARAEHDRDDATAVRDREEAAAAREREDATAMREREHTDRTTADDEPRFERGAPAAERERSAEPAREQRPMRRPPVLGTDALDTMRSRQRERFGGIQWGSAFFGWLSAVGLAAILSAILVGAGVALGLSTSDAQDAQQAETIGIGGGIALLVVLAVAWFSGGYVAGRMARFDGARQGIGVWAWTLVAAIAVAALAAIGGSEFDVFERLNLPRIAIGDSTLTGGGAITGVAAILVTLLAAIVGGKVGERFHKRVDRVATTEYTGP